MPAGTFNLTGNYRMEQGSTYTLEVTVTDDSGVYDMSTATAAAKLRETADATTAYEFDCTINSTTGVITVTMSATDTADIAITSGVWDLELTEGTTVTRLLEGTVTISPEVTKT
ncbi:MAG: hypothetical protein WC332_00875 [Clostridia bacterium]|jgi:hypothetical protein